MGAQADPDDRRDCHATVDPSLLKFSDHWLFSTVLCTHGLGLLGILLIHIYPYIWKINYGVKADFERLLFYGVADSEGGGRGTVNARDCHETRESLFLN